MLNKRVEMEHALEDIVATLPAMSKPEQLYLLAVITAARIRARARKSIRLRPRPAAAKLKAPAA